MLYTPYLHTFLVFQTCHCYVDIEINFEFGLIRQHICLINFNVERKSIY